MDRFRFKRELAQLTVEYLKAFHEALANDPIGTRLSISLWTSLLPPQLKNHGYAQSWASRVRRCAQDSLRSATVTDSQFGVLKRIVVLCSEMMNLYTSPVRLSNREEHTACRCSCKWCTGTVYNCTHDPCDLGAE